jgi:hypothetical protein
MMYKPVVKEDNGLCSGPLIPFPLETLQVSRVAANIALDHRDSASDMLVALGLWGDEGVEISLKLYDGIREDGSLSSLLYAETLMLDVTGVQMINLSGELDVSEVDDLWLSYEVDGGVGSFFDYSDPSALEGSYYLDGGEWLAASSTGKFSPTTFYMIPEPATAGLLVGAGLLIVAYRRFFGRV